MVEPPSAQEDTLPHVIFLRSHGFLGLDPQSASSRYRMHPTGRMYGA